ncbi:hypothetical protein ACJJTC_012834 [Scirpophaga incertulas]
MRTVDPELWSGDLRKPSISWQFGQQPDKGWEAILRGGFCDALREYRQHCSIKSLVEFPESRPFRHQQVSNPNISQQTGHRKTVFSAKLTHSCSSFFYILVTCALLVWGLAVVVYVNVEYERKPLLQVNLRPRSQQAEALPFPAIAVCSNCVITRSALDAYAAYLASKSSAHMGLDTIKENLKNFGAIVTMTAQRQDIQFMRFLYSVDPKFNVTELMYQLSPNCSKMLKRCSWRGNNVDCHRLFAKRATPLGFCCVFNSRYYPEDIGNTPKVLDLVGQNFGLGAVITEDSEDFAVIRRPIIGFDVLIFESSEYPLLEGGSVRMYPVTNNGSAYFALSARAHYASPSLAAYSEEWRGCRLRQDQGGRGAHSSYSWCLTECRRRAAAALCQCLPFTLLPAPGDVLCTPEHLRCLHKHKMPALHAAARPGRRALHARAPALPPQAQE